MKTLPTLPLLVALLLAPLAALHAAADAPAGYPKPISFRAATPEILSEMDRL